MPLEQAGLVDDPPIGQGEFGRRLPDQRDQSPTKPRESEHRGADPQRDGDPRLLVRPAREDEADKGEDQQQRSPSDK